MKKLYAFIISIVFVVCLSGCFVEEISVFYTDLGEKDGFTIAVNETGNCCFVSQYNCTEYTENQEILIPDEYEGTPITRIGGYYGKGGPMPFVISVSELYMNAPEESRYHTVFSGDISKFDFPDEYNVENLVFNLNMGKNIEVIKNVTMDVYYPHINEDGSVTFYHPVVNINCSEENEYFYSENGKLYDKKTDELITEFAYANSSA